MAAATRPASEGAEAAPKAPRVGANSAAERIGTNEKGLLMGAPSLRPGGTRPLVMAVVLVLLRVIARRSAALVGAARPVDGPGLAVVGRGLGPARHPILSRSGAIGIGRGLPLAQAAEHASLVRAPLTAVAALIAHARRGRGRETPAAALVSTAAVPPILEGAAGERVPLQTPIHAPRSQRVLRRADVLAVASAAQVVPKARRAVRHRAGIRKLTTIEAVPAGLTARIDAAVAVVAVDASVPVGAAVPVEGARRKRPVGGDRLRRAQSAAAAAVHADVVVREAARIQTPYALRPVDRDRVDPAVRGALDVPHVGPVVHDDVVLDPDVVVDDLGLVDEHVRLRRRQDVRAHVAEEEVVRVDEDE